MAMSGVGRLIGPSEKQLQWDSIPIQIAYEVKLSALVEGTEKEVLGIVMFHKQPLFSDALMLAFNLKHDGQHKVSIFNSNYFSKLVK